MSKFDLFEVSCKAVLFNEDRTKIVLSEYDDGRYGLVGGHVEYGEDLDKTMRREIQEEINFNYQGELKRTGFTLHEWNDHHKVILVFTGTLPDDFEPKLEDNNPERVVAQKWVSINEIFQDDFDLVGDYKNVIKEII